VTRETFGKGVTDYRNPNLAAALRDPRRDPSCLGVLRHYRSLASMAKDAHKPMFALTVADGAMGSHLAAAGQAYDDFSELAERIAAATWRRNPA